MIRKDFYIPEPLVEELRRLAQERDISEAEVVRRALEEYLKRESR